MNIRTSHRVQGFRPSVSQERGAALIVALSVFLVLLSLAITFSLIVRYETQMTQQATSRALAERLLDGAMAQAQYRLNRDLDLHADAMSLDHGWRTRFNGAAFVGKSWAQQFQGEKAHQPLYKNAEGLICVNLEPVERVLRGMGRLADGVLYAHFLKDGHLEPLFRGPRTESWLYVPRMQGNAILLYASRYEVELVNSLGEVLSPADLNNALTGLRSERFAFWDDQIDPDKPNDEIFPFAVPNDLSPDIDPATGLVLSALPQEKVNQWADVDSTGDGMSDAIWMPIVQDVNHFGDGIDNMLSGRPDPARSVDGEFIPLHESAPFVYHGLGLPRAARSEDLFELDQMKNLHFAGRFEDPPLGDGYDNNNDGMVDDLSENQLFLTVPLPGLMMQVDLNSDGLFDERDYYEFNNYRGPLYVQLPPIIYVPVIVGMDALGEPLYDRIPLSIDAVDMLDNDYDLMANNFRSYAYVGPHEKLTDASAADLYAGKQIPFSRASAAEAHAHYTAWMPYKDPVEDTVGWLGPDRKDRLFSDAHHRAYHDINVDAVLNGPGALRLFIVPADAASGAGVLSKVELPAGNPLAKILRQPNALRVTCSGEPVSEVIGRYAGHISDESGTVDLNAAGGYYSDEISGDLPSLHLGQTLFEYNTRVLPDIGKGRSYDFWLMRTGSDDPLGTVDEFFPGYHLVDDNGNALLLALKGWNYSGHFLNGKGLDIPAMSGATREYLFNNVSSPLATYEDQTLRLKQRLTMLGRFDGIDEPSELQLYNPLKNREDPARSDRLFLRKEDLKRHGDVGPNRWDYLKNLVTVNSEKRNTFHTRNSGKTENFYQIDPNTATPQQIATAMLFRADVTNVVDKMHLPSFAEGLRQFDTAFSGDLMGKVKTGLGMGTTPFGTFFPADPILQIMRLAADITSARNPNPGVVKLTTDPLPRDPTIYRKYNLFSGIANSILLPAESWNERERIADENVLPTGDLQAALTGTSGEEFDQKRLISPDTWWKQQTGEDRLIQYATSSLDSIRINEIMVRPVRRVEAEMVAGAAVLPELNLNPAPVDGMLPFELERRFLQNPPENWSLRSAYDYPGHAQPLLGDRTAWVYTPDDPLVPADPRDVMEFRFKESPGLPAGNYYLLANLTDQYGRMTVADVDVLEYAIRYTGTGGPGVFEDFAEEASLAALFAQIGYAGTASDLQLLTSKNFQRINAPEFLATESMRMHGSASAPGWAFLPHRNAFLELSDTPNLLDDFEYYIKTKLPGFALPPDATMQDLLLTFWTVVMGCPSPPADATWEALNEYATVNGCVLPPPADPNDLLDPLTTDNAWYNLLGLLSRFYGIGGAYSAGGTETGYTVFIPPLASGQELVVAIRMNPVVRASYQEVINECIANNDFAGIPDPVTVADWQFLQGLISAGVVLRDANDFPKPLFAINFFDFSQEPSHEYIELANISDEEVDLSGWVLEIGVPDPPGATHDPMMKDPYKSQWEIPANIKIAPQGYLLLSADIADSTGNNHLFNSNRLGLKSDGTDAITVPPIHNQFSPDPVALPVLEPLLHDETGSVFLRKDGIDYIDNDGDGLSSQLMWGVNAVPTTESDFERRDTDHVLSEMRTHGTGPGGQGIPAGSRIVPLINRQLWKENSRSHPDANPTAMEKYLYKLNPFTPDQQSVNITDLKDTEEGLKYLSRFLLRGGLFPNYPERDGIDNDGDGGYAVRNSIKGYVPVIPSVYEQELISYVPGTLDKDMIDNNLNGMMDNRGYERIRASQNYTPSINLPGFTYDSHANPLLSEGVDEGRLGFPIWYTGGILSGFQGFLPPAATGLPRFYGPGSYEQTFLPLYNLNTPAAAQDYNEWARRMAAGTISFSIEDPSLGYTMTVAPASFNTGFAPVLAASDSPDWQAFVERRWNSGDNVIVTLYVGHPSRSIIADQVTYTEQDVINRTKDDIVDCPYTIQGFTSYGFDGSGNLAWVPPSSASAPYEPVCLAPADPGRHSFWLPDHMGLDFYRSLERKHPMYHGDRFGLANRWTATDGAYDDWAESMSLFETGLGLMNLDTNDAPIAVRWPGRQAYMADHTTATGTYRQRFDQKLDPAYKDHALQLYGHAFWGSPLRMNTQARLWENPLDILQVNSDVKEWLNPEASPIRNQRYYRQFAGLDAYRNTGHDLNLSINVSSLTDDPTKDKERRLSSDWAVRRAKLRKKPFATLGDLVELPCFSFEKIIEGPSQASAEYVPQYAVSVVNTHYMSTETKSSGGTGVLHYSDHLELFTYGADRDLTSALLGQAVYGGGGSMHGPRGKDNQPPTLVKDTLATAAMNPVILTVGQAQVVPLWPAPDSVNPSTGSVLDPADLYSLFQWKDGLPPHMWTPVYLFNLPVYGDWYEEKPWQTVQYPRRYDGSSIGFSPPVTNVLVEPVYIFNGEFICRQYGLSLPDDAEWVASKWPVRTEVTLQSDAAGRRQPTDRACMYVSRYIPDYGSENRPEVLFVWDKETGLENGDYMAYVGTFIPGMRKTIEHTKAVADDYFGRTATPLPPARPSFLYDGPTAARTEAILNLDPTHPSMLKNLTAPRFDPRLAIEFITNRRDAEQMLEPVELTAVSAGSGHHGMPHPADWLSNSPGSAVAGYCKADQQGYVFYSDNPSLAWRPIPVRVENNYLALRVRNLGDPNQVACITHVVLAPAPRTRGVINVNTSETKQVVRGASAKAANWTIELFNPLAGLPGVINALNVQGDFTRAPYKPDDDLGLPGAVYSKGLSQDPMRRRWQTTEEKTFLNQLGSFPPPVQDDRDRPSLLYGSDPNAAPEWNENRDGRAVLRLSSLITAGRPHHGDGRYYESIGELLYGCYAGGIALVDGNDGPWPLSNLGLPTQGNSNSFTIMNDVNQLALRYNHQMEARHDEIVKRFRMMANLITTRSNVFEIIATVQAGQVSDLNGDGVLDYRGGEFTPLAETQGRMVYDVRPRAVFQDEYRPTAP